MNHGKHQFSYSSKEEFYKGVSKSEKHGYPDKDIWDKKSQITKEKLELLKEEELWNS